MYLFKTRIPTGNKIMEIVVDENMKRTIRMVPAERDSLVELQLIVNDEKDNEYIKNVIPYVLDCCLPSGSLIDRDVVIEDGYVYVKLSYKPESNDPMESQGVLIGMIKEINDLFNRLSFIISTGISRYIILTSIHDGGANLNELTLKTRNVKELKKLRKSLKKLNESQEKLLIELAGCFNIPYNVVESMPLDEKTAFMDIVIKFAEDLQEIRKRHAGDYDFMSVL